MAISDLKSLSTRVVKGPPCEVCEMLSSLDDTESAALRALLADTTIRYSVLAAALRDDPDTDFHVSPNTLSRHARGNCSAREKLR